MATIKIMTLGNEKGFALLAAIVASLIILAVGMLVINMSVGDLRATSMTVCSKKALAATESGIHRMIQDFDPSGSWDAAHNYSPLHDLSGNLCGTANYSSSNYIWRSIPGGTDANTKFAICAPTTSNMAFIPFPGSAIGEWGMMRYDANIVGENTNITCNQLGTASLETVTVGIGYGPVPMK